MTTATAAAPGIELTDAAAYRKKLEGLLGSQDPIQVLGQTPDRLARIVAENSVKLMRTRPYPGKWTPNEIIGHLSDTEWVYGFRVRLILCQDKPTILGMDQDLWVAGQKHNDREPKDLVELFRNLRSANLVLWKQLQASDLTRIGKHNERGDESLGQMLRMEAGHDLSHIDQINRYLEAARKIA